MSKVKKAALEYATERVPESAKFKECIIIGNQIKEEIHDAFIRGFEFANQWIPIEQPPIESCEILIKNSDSDIFVAYYDMLMDDFLGFYGTVTHYRFIL